MQEQQGEYRPQIAEIDDLLLNPPDIEALKKNAINTGVLHLDAVRPTGLDVVNGEMIAVQGNEGERKTTFVLNLVRNICNSGRLGPRTILWDTLESGSSPVKVKQSLVCMEATALLAMEIWGSATKLPMSVMDAGSEYKYANMKAICSRLDEKTGRPLFTMSPGRMMGSDRLPIQQAVLEQALKNVNSWPLLICGAPNRQGGTKVITSPPNGDGLLDEHFPYKRWKGFAGKFGTKIVVVDHASAYSIMNPYDLIMRFTAHAAGVVAELNMVLMAVTQTSLSSQREYAVGGPRISQESSGVWATKYKRANPYNLQLEPKKSRYEPPPRMNIPIEPHSGLLFPWSHPIQARTRR